MSNTLDNLLLTKGRDKMTLRRKILLAIISLVFIPVLAMGVISYYSFSKSIENKTTDYYMISLQDTDRKLQYALNEMNSLSDYIILQPLIQDMLARDEPIVSSAQRKEFNSLISHPKITSISLYSNTQRIYYTGGVTFNYQYSALLSQPWYINVLDNEGIPVWLGPYVYNNFIQLTHARIIKDYHTLEDIGTLVITVKSDILEQIFWEAATLKKGDLYLINNSGIVMYSKSGNFMGERLSAPFIHHQIDTPSYVDKINGTETFVTYIPSSIDGWYLVAMTDLQDVRSETLHIRNIALGLLLISLLLALCFDLLFVSKLVSAIIKVVHGMKRVEQGSFIEIKNAGSVKDESGLLVSGFNRMSEQIKELIYRVEEEQGRKKEAEMQALVSQINPHFIYNSLESINSLAVIHGNKDISKMVVSLGKLLRISISETNELIPLTTELEHVRHYLNIQKYRFGDKFEYEIVIPDRLKHHESLKLLVQPVVENALYHGIEPMDGKGLIKVMVLETERDLLIRVSDNGHGMDGQRLQELFGADPLSGEKKYKQQGVGMRNVHERLRIRFGAYYGLTICSSLHQGTIVQIRMPKLNMTGKWMDDRSDGEKK